MRNVVITSAARTAVGKYLGSFKSVEAQDLSAEIIREVAKKSNIRLEQIEQVIMGEVYGYTPNVARCAALIAGVPVETPAYTVDRQCASSLQAVVSGMYEILSGEEDIVCACGVEIMSRFTYYLDPEVRANPLKSGNKQLYDSFTQAVTLVQPKSLYPNTNMGLTAENIAKKYGITREEQDKFALDSQMKMAKAQAKGLFNEEIMPYTVTNRNGTTVVLKDEHNKPETTLESLSKLKPTFLKDGTGTVTAGNSSGMNDGASGVILMSEEKALELGVQPLVKIVATSADGVDPRYMGLGPVPAIKNVLKKANLELNDIDLLELNEAFAAQAIGCLRELGISMNDDFYRDRINVNGGAIAHGHALGNSGTRILTTLIYELKRRNGKYGIATLCIGGGQGLACLIENCK